MNRLECEAETLRAALNSLPVAVPDWLRAQVPLEWYVRHGTRTEEYRFPKAASKRQVFTEQIGSDGAWLLMISSPYDPEAHLSIKRSTV